MQFDKLEIAGAFAVTPEPNVDERGAFARLFCAREFASRGLVDRFVQHSVSLNARRGTVRGLHFQAAPFTETKLVRCVRGAIFDVIVDLRPKSPTFGRWCALDLSASAWTSIYIPEGCAHGYQTLRDDCEVEYLTTPEYAPAAARGIRWDDPAIAIAWPIPDDVIASPRDRQMPLFDPLRSDYFM